jgi:hypothetical protein
MPTITLSPTSGEPGITITVKGTGFNRHQRIQMRIDPPDGTVKSYRCSTSGTFIGTVATGSQSSIGTHKINITSYSTVLASGTFILTKPVQPPPPTPLPTAPRNLKAVAGDKIITLSWGL